MTRRSMFLLLALLCTRDALGATPRSVDPRLTIELFAEQPQLVTPTGIDVDRHGRVWIIESNTHFPPEGYAGHSSDRVLILREADGDGRADEPHLFLDGLKHTMSVAVRPVWMDEIRLAAEESPPAADAVARPAITQVFLATRREILLLEDLDGDDLCDRQTRLAWLETKGDYPHNGLAGFAFDALGWMYFGFGENLGEPYTLYSREMDGGTDNGAPPPLQGGAEGGNIYRMRPDGTGLSHWATGFWNPHASCVDAFGRLFTVDNDPDSRPPCRLLHVIPGGDYGYRFRNGRKGLHPFTSWNGEIPGTLPMVAGTGEAPSGILAYEHDAFPAEYLGRLLVTSWGDHRIDTFQLKPKGASFESIAEPLIVGDEDFRPVGIALAPDGSLYCSDWVQRDYKVHGKGRVWRIRAKNDVQPRGDSPLSKLPALQEHGGAAVEPDRASAALASLSLVERRLGAQSLTKTADGRKLLVSRLADSRIPVRQRIEILWAIARTPIEVHNFGLRPGDYQKPENAPIAAAFDETATALMPLLGSQQFPFDGVHGLFTEDGLTPTTWFRNRPVAAMNREEISRFSLATFGLDFRSYQTMQGEISGRFSSPNEFDEVLGDLYGDDFESTIDPFFTGAIVPALARWGHGGDGTPFIDGMSTQYFECFWVKTRPHYERICTLLAARRRSAGSQSMNDSVIRLGLTDPSPSVRRLAVQWVAEEQLQSYRPLVESVLRSEPMTADLFVATLAGLEMLDGKPPQEFDKSPVGKYVLPILKDDSTPATIKTQALRLIDPADPELGAPLLAALSQSENQPLQLEAVRSLGALTDGDAVTRLIALVETAGESSASKSLVAEAVLGLANAIRNPDTSETSQQALIHALIDPTKDQFFAVRDLELGSGIVRSLRSAIDDPDVRRAVDLYAATVHRFGLAHGPGPEGPTEIYQQALLALGKDRLPESLRAMGELNRLPDSPDAWRTILNVPPANDDSSVEHAAARGRFVFFHPNGPGCFKCHTVEGRGGRVGPDLSRIGAALTREKLIESILTPSQEVSPQFTTWQMVTTAGVVHTGMIVHENEGMTLLGDAEGKTVELKTIDIAERLPQQKSTMPDGLQERMTVQEFRDLLAYLESLGR